LELFQFVLELANKESKRQQHHQRKSKMLKIIYYCKDGKQIGEYLTNEKWNNDSLKDWEEWLNDYNLDHPAAPQGWSSFELVKY